MVRGVLWIAALGALFCGCIQSKPPPAITFSPPPRIAVLFFANDTPYPGLSGIYEVIVTLRLIQKGYTVMPSWEAAGKLRSVGVTGAETLGKLNWKVVSLACENYPLYVHGCVLEHSAIDIGIARNPRTGIGLTMVDSGGNVIWKDAVILSRPSVKFSALTSTEAMVAALIERLGRGSTDGLFSRKAIGQMVQSVDLLLLKWPAVGGS